MFVYRGFRNAARHRTIASGSVRAALFMVDEQSVAGDRVNGCALAHVYLHHSPRFKFPIHAFYKLLNASNNGQIRLRAPALYTVISSNHITKGNRGLHRTVVMTSGHKYATVKRSTNRGASQTRQHFQRTRNKSKVFANCAPMRKTQFSQQQQQQRCKLTLAATVL